MSRHCPCLRCCLQPVRTFATPGFCFVHVGNAFESEHRATLDIDLGVFESASILNDLKMAHLRQGPSDGSDITGCQYMRLSLPLSDADPDAADSSSQLPVGAFRGAQGFGVLLSSYSAPACVCNLSRTHPPGVVPPTVGYSSMWQVFGCAQQHVMVAVCDPVTAGSRAAKDVCCLHHFAGSGASDP